MTLKNLQDLYVEELKDLYSAETQLITALPKAAKAAHSPELKKAFEMHLEQTRGHAKRVEAILRELGESPEGKTCMGMKGLIEEVEELLGERGADAVLDAGLISHAQRIEHYEIAGYGCVKAYALQLEREQDVRAFQQTLDEEGDTDRKLTRLAEETINLEATIA